VAIVLAITMGPVHLIVVVGHEPVMGGDEVGPGLGMGEVPVSHPALHVEVRLDIGLPGLLPVDLLLPDPQRRIDPHRFLGLKDAAAVAHQCLRTAVLANGSVEHHQVRGEILGAGHGTGEDRPAEVLQDGDDVDHPATQLMHIKVANVDCPILMAATRLEGHWSGFMWLRGWTRQLIEERLSARMRPHVRGLSVMPIWRKAAWTRNSPNSGFSCSLRTSFIARRSAFLVGCLGALDLSASPDTPSSIQRRRVV
jgi:hypothetical protein